MFYCRTAGPATNLSEVARVVLVEQDAMVMLSTSVTATARMLAVLADTAMTGADVPALLAVLAETCARVSR